MFKISKKIFYIILFGILWLITAFSSFFHAVEFFELSNVTWMGVILALAFEIGQASTLMSILTSKQNQKKYTPWILMCILTLVQIIGNVYSSYKYIMLNSPENLKYFKEPIFIWTQLPDDQATVIVTYVSAAILPIVALLMTSMITNYLSEQEALQKDQEEINKQLKNKNEESSNSDNEQQSDIEEIEKLKQELETERSVHKDISKDYPKIVEENNKKDEEIDNLKKELEKLRNDKTQFDEEKNKSDNDDEKRDVETSGSETTTESETPENHASINIEKDEEINSGNNKQGVEQIELKKENNDVEKITLENKQEEKQTNVEFLEGEHDSNLADTSKLEDTVETEDQNIEEHKRQSHFINL